jgi:replication factor C large subunit
MWSEKYKPRKLAMMVGNEASRLRFYRWLKDWKPKTKPVMLIGSPGTGKTTIVHLVAEELGYTLVELNASDFRSKSVLEGKLGPVLTNTTLMDVKLLIFFDEADGIESREDYGAVDFITELLQKVKHPIVLAANAGDASAVEKLAKKSEVIQFTRVSARSLELYARRILDQEEIEKNPTVLSEAVSKSRGDVRAMINNLQEISTSKTPHTLTSRDEYLSIQETITRLSAHPQSMTQERS